MTSDADVRSLPVPDGLDGLRVDVAVARMFGLSRTAAADLADAGAVVLGGRAVRKSDRVGGGVWLEVALPGAAAPAPPPEVVPGGRVVYEDDALVVVDKPVGVASHPSPGWTGPTVIGGLAAAGHRIATPRPPARPGTPHRLPTRPT